MTVDLNQIRKNDQNRKDINCNKLLYSNIHSTVASEGQRNTQGNSIFKQSFFLIEKKVSFFSYIPW